MLRIAMLSLPLVLGAAAISAPAQAGFKPTDYIRMGEKALQSGKNDRARKHASRVLKISDNARIKGAAYSILCRADVADEAVETALAHCEAAVAAQPGNWRTYYARAQALSLVGSYDNALADYAQAKDLGCDKPDLDSHMASLRTKLAGVGN